MKFEYHNLVANLNKNTTSLSSFYHYKDKVPLESDKGKQTYTLSIGLSICKNVLYHKQHSLIVEFHRILKALHIHLYYH